MRYSSVQFLAFSTLALFFSLWLSVNILSPFNTPNSAWRKVASSEQTKVMGFLSLESFNQKGVQYACGLHLKDPLFGPGRDSLVLWVLGDSLRESILGLWDTSEVIICPQRAVSSLRLHCIPLPSLISFYFWLFWVGLPNLFSSSGLGMSMIFRGTTSHFLCSLLCSTRNTIVNWKRTAHLSSSTI